MHSGAATVMVSLRIRHHHARHAAPKPAPYRGHVREMPDCPPVPAEYWPALRWLEARARGVRADPEHEAAMTALHGELERWQQEQRQA